MELQRELLSADVTLINYKTDNCRKCIECRGAKANKVEAIGYSSISSSPRTASQTPTGRSLCPYCINIRLVFRSPILHHSPRRQSMTLPFAESFWWSINHTTTRWPAIPLQIRVNLIKMLEANLPILPTGRLGLPPNGFQGRSTP